MPDTTTFDPTAQAWTLHPEGQKNSPEMDVGEYNALVASIDGNGYVGDPVVLMRSGEETVVIDGRHRLTAAKQLGISSVPAIFVDWPDARVRTEMMIRNVYRRHLSKVTIAHLLLTENPDMKADAIAEATGLGKASAARARAEALKKIEVGAKPGEPLTPAQKAEIKTNTKRLPKPYREWRLKMTPELHDWLDVWLTRNDYHGGNDVAVGTSKLLHQIAEAEQAGKQAQLVISDT